MNEINFNLTNPNRARSLLTIEKVEKKLLRQIRKRDYWIPRGYIGWKTLSGIIALSLSTCEIKYASVDISTFLHSYRTALWFAQDAPIYCLTKELIEAFDNTDALHKPGILAGWKPSLPTFLLAIPKGLIHTPDDGEIDYLVVSCNDSEYPEWNQAKWKHIQIEPFKLEHKLHFQICTVDSKETVWMSGTAIAPDNSLIYQENSNLGKSLMTSDDRQFIGRIRNLVINTLLALEFSPSLLSNVTEIETRAKAGGFAIKSPSSNTRYPRWLGKNYQTRSEPSTLLNLSTHSSPRSHWRRGHWRVLESGEGKPWKQSKRLWIEPVFIN